MGASLTLFTTRLLVTQRPHLRTWWSLQKMLDEKAELELDKKIFAAEKTADAEIVKIRKEYAVKIESELKTERNKMQEFMTQVMASLPNVNLKLKG